jgi:hypothetical protein
MLPNLNTTKLEPWWSKDNAVLVPFNRDFYKVIISNMFTIF